MKKMTIVVLLTICWLLLVAGFLVLAINVSTEMELLEIQETMLTKDGWQSSYREGSWMISPEDLIRRAEGEVVE